MEDVEGGSEGGDVAGNVVEATGSRTLEAVLGDGIADVLDGVVGNFEGVAVRVDEGAAGILDVGLASRAKRREGGVRGRASGRIEGRSGRRSG